jgi:Tfp pilus assembly protein PilO
MRIGSRYFQKVLSTYAQKPEVKASLELLLTLLAISFFTVFAIRPTINTIASLWASVKEQEETRRLLDEKIKALQEAQQVLAKNQSRLAIVDQALPTRSDPENIIQQLEKLTESLQVNLKSLAIGQTTLVGKQQADQTQEKPGEFDINLSVSGSFESVFSFLSSLENLKRIITVESVNLVSDQTERGLITANIAGTAHYYTKP